jgi:hypothetical protein
LVGGYRNPFPEIFSATCKGLLFSLVYSSYIRYYNSGALMGWDIVWFRPPFFVRINMAKGNSKDNPYSGIAEKVEKIMAGLAEQMPNLSPNDLAVVHRTMKFLARNTRAGAERLAILHLLGTNEAVPGTVLYQLCSQRVEKRVRELQSVGIDIRRWSEVRPDGYYHSVYGWSGFRLWQEHRLLNEGEDKQPSLRRVM